MDRRVIRRLAKGLRELGFAEAGAGRGAQGDLPAVLRIRGRSGVRRLADLRGGPTAEAPVVGIHLFDGDVRPLGRLVQYALQGLGDFLDDLGFLLGGGSLAGNANADEWHGGLRYGLAC